MDMVKLGLLTMIAVGCAAASDFTIEIGSPAAVTANAQAPQKMKGAVFSVRAQNCPEVQFSGVAHSESGSKQQVQSLTFIPGSVPGSYAVTRSAQAWANWVAVITAECRGNKLGVLMPVSATGTYDRAAAKFVPRTPTPADMEEALRAMQAASR